jgi:uncharacterized membrane protein
MAAKVAAKTKQLPSFQKPKDISCNQLATNHLLMFKQRLYYFIQYLYFFIILHIGAWKLVLFLVLLLQRTIACPTCTFHIIPLLASHCLLFTAATALRHCPVGQLAVALLYAFHSFLVFCIGQPNAWLVSIYLCQPKIGG